MILFLLPLISLSKNLTKSSGSMPVFALFSDNIDIPLIRLII